MSDRGGVMTVNGEIGLDELGLTLMHEHILVDARSWWRGLGSGASERVATGPVDASILGELRMDPFANRDNCVLDDVDAAVEELGRFAGLGGRTVVEATCASIGRDPAALRQISEQTGLHIVMGAGYYLEGSHPDHFAGMSVDDVADEIVRDATEGVGDTGVRSGIIGEIGVSADFTPAEQKSLRGASRAQRRTGLPLMVHLPGWFRRGGEVLDIVEEEGADPTRTVLAHMNPSGADFDYQAALADRGAYIEYDMVGMDYYYADQEAQCPSDEENATHVARLVAAGYGHKVLLSQDVFLKMMLTRYGGFGYDYILRHFAPRLRRHGLSEAQVQTLLESNPRDVFMAVVDH